MGLQFSLEVNTLNNQTRPVLDQLEIWARNAGAILREGYGKMHQIDFKGEKDIVTEIDHRSEEYVIGEIKRHFPDHTILGEESGELNSGNQECWYVDPLDGTINYAHDLPFFSVSIAYGIGSYILLGVVYDPLRDECFSAERGKGARLNGQHIQVSSTKDLIKSLLVTGFPPKLDGLVMRDNLGHFSKFVLAARSVRRLGSAALDFCYVASGRLDGYWELYLQPWDIAAGALIAEEAGAKVTTLDGGKDYMKPPYESIVANPILHEKIKAMIKN
jgi:myo-inositol-1(or 4)-monophosphatase